MLKIFKKIFKKVPKENTRNNIAVFVDGPNMLRKEFNIDLFKIKSQLQKEGPLKIARVYLDQYANDKLIEAVVNIGFESIITVGDVDVAMAVDATEAAYSTEIDTVVFITRDSDYLPAILKAKRQGKKTIVYLVEDGSAVALKNTVDRVVFIK
jgi:uncharacterized protein (TIGR00288 family)